MVTHPPESAHSSFSGAYFPFALLKKQTKKPLALFWVSQLNSFLGDENWGNSTIHQLVIVWHVTFWDWLLSLSIMLEDPSKLVHGWIVHSFWMVFHFVDVPHTVYSSTTWGTFGLFPVLGNYEQSRYKHSRIVFGWIQFFISLKLIPRNGNAGSYGNCIFIRNCYIVFPSSCKILHSQQQRMS